MGELATTAAGGDLGWRNTAVAEAADLIPNGHLISAEGCPALKEPNYTLHFTREGYETFGKRYAEKMLELLNAMESVPDTVPADSIVSDSTATDSLDVPGDSVITALPTVRSVAAQSHGARLVFDRKKQKVFLRVEKDGIARMFEVTGNR